MKIIAEALQIKTESKERGICLIQQLKIELVSRSIKCLIQAHWRCSSVVYINAPVAEYSNNNDLEVPATVVFPLTYLSPQAAFAQNSPSLDIKHERTIKRDTFYQQTVYQVFSSLINHTLKTSYIWDQVRLHLRVKYGYSSFPKLNSFFESNLSKLFRRTLKLLGGTINSSKESLKKPQFIRSLLSSENSLLSLLVLNPRLKSYQFELPCDFSQILWEEGLSGLERQKNDLLNQFDTKATFVYSLKDES